MFNYILQTLHKLFLTLEVGLKSVSNEIQVFKFTENIYNVKKLCFVRKYSKHGSQTTVKAKLSCLP